MACPCTTNKPRGEEEEGEGLVRCGGCLRAMRSADGLREMAQREAAGCCSCFDVRAQMHDDDALNATGERMYFN